MVHLGPGGISPKATNALIIIIALVWASSYLGEALIPERFDPPGGVNEVMMIVVGYLFARKATSSGGDDEPKDSKQNKEGDNSNEQPAI